MMILKELPEMFTRAECHELRNDIVQALQDQEDDGDFDFDRSRAENPQLAEILAERLKPIIQVLLPDENWFVHPVLAYHRYNTSGSMRPHFDSQKVEENASSIASILLYVNDDFAGGSTQFESTAVKPEVGKVLLISHDLLHKANVVTDGAKYIIRTALMVRDLKPRQTNIDATIRLYKNLL